MMTTYIIRRLLQLIPVLIGVTILVFSLMHLTPGNPALILAGEHAPPETIRAIEKRLGLDQPLHVQYFDFLKNVVQLEFGTSMRDRLPVIDHIKPRIGTTIALAIYSTIFSIFFGLIIGIISAVRKYRSEEHTSELQSRGHLVCRLLLEKKKKKGKRMRK